MWIGLEKINAVIESAAILFFRKPNKFKEPMDNKEVMKYMYCDTFL